MGHQALVAGISSARDNGLSHSGWWLVIASIQVRCRGSRAASPGGQCARGTLDVAVRQVANQNPSLRQARSLHVAKGLGMNASGRSNSDG